MLVCPGNYAGGILVYQSGITIKPGGAQGSAKIVGSASAPPLYGFDVVANNVQVPDFDISGFTVSPDAAGIFVGGHRIGDDDNRASNTVIQYNLIHGNVNGIVLWQTNGNGVENNEIYGSIDLDGTGGIGIKVISGRNDTETSDANTWRRSGRSNNVSGNSVLDNDRMAVYVSTVASSVMADVTGTVVGQNQIFNNGAGTTFAATESALGSWSAPVALSTQSVDAANSIAIGGLGQAVAVFESAAGGSAFPVQAVSSVLGGAWSAPATISGASNNPGNLNLAATPLGTFVVGWVDGVSGTAYAAVRPSGSTAFQAPTVVGGGSQLILGTGLYLASSDAFTNPAPQRVRITGHVPIHSIRSASRVERLRGDAMMSMGFALPLRNQSELRGLLRRLYDPSDPLFGHYLTAKEFTSRFAPTQAEYDSLIAYAAAQGLRVTGTHPNRLLLDVSGLAAQAEAAFNLRLIRYRAAGGREFYAPDTDPEVPESVAPFIAGVIGLDSAAVWHSYSRAVRVRESSSLSSDLIGTGPFGGLTPSDIETAYNLNSGPNGSGQTLALFELSG